MNKRMHKHALRRNIRIFVGQPVLQTGGKRPFESLRELIGLVTAGAGVFVALLYLAGRSFAGGYFAAMNIPNYQVSFSLWEYGEVAWIPLLLYPSGMIVVAGLLWGTVFMILDWLKQRIKIKRPTWRSPEISRQAKQWFSLVGNTFTFLLFIILVIYTLIAVHQFGEWNGKFTVLENAAQTEVVSAVPLALDDNHLAGIESSGQNYYIYKGLHLLTFNNGKYYLFKEVDQVTCKPSKVYIIDAEQNVQINLLPAESLADKCQKSDNSTITITPTPTTSTAP